MVVLAVVLGVLGAGCVASQETRGGADELREVLGVPEWAASVEVDTGRDGQLADYVRTTVTLSPSATPDDVTGFVVAMPGAVVEAGLEDIPNLKGLRIVAADGAELEIDWQGAAVADEVSRGVTEWFAVAEALGDAVDADLSSDGGATYVVTLGETARSAVAETYGVLESLAEPDTAWQVDATAGALALQLSGSVIPTGEQLGVWKDLVEALDRLPVDLPASELSLHLLDRIVVDVTLVVPDDTTSETFTIEAYGDRIWPVVRPQLDAMRTLSDEWSYFANWAPAAAPTSRNGFISLLTDLPTTDNGDESTRWSQAAKDYLG